MEASQTNIEYPDPKPTDYENWFEYRNGVSKNPDYDDGGWHLSIFFIIAKVKSKNFVNF